MNFRISIAMILLLLASSLQALQSTLIIRADAPCALTVNGADQGNLAVDDAKAVEVRPGQQLIACSTGEIQVQERSEVPGGQQVIIDLKLKARIDAIESGITTRYSAPGDGTVVDSHTGLVWVQRENSGHVNWNEALSYCRSLNTAGGDWRLPTMDELGELFDPSGTLATRCGSYTCNAPPQLQLSNSMYWSSDRANSEEARYFDLNDGFRHRFPIDLTGRALCVRGPS